MKSVCNYLESLEDEKRNELIDACCHGEKHEELSSAKALSKAIKAVASSTSNASVTAAPS